MKETERERERGETEGMSGVSFEPCLICQQVWAQKLMVFIQEACFVIFVEILFPS